MSLRGGLASARDFETPVAAFDGDGGRGGDDGESSRGGGGGSDEKPWRVVHKFLGELFEAEQVSIEHP
jgi:hypothetical protein